MADARIALVTGAGKGIGRAVALRLAAMGFLVAVNYNRSEKAADEACRLIRTEAELPFPLRQTFLPEATLRPCLPMWNADLDPLPYSSTTRE